MLDTFRVAPCTTSRIFRHMHTIGRLKKATCHSSGTSIHGCSNQLSIKRQRVQMLAECYLKVTERNTDDLAERNVLDITDYAYTCMQSDCVHRQIRLRALDRPSFSDNLDSTYASSLTRDLYRRYKYGADVTKVCKRGSIPEEAREMWWGIAAKHRAEAEAHSNSDSGD